MGTRTAGLFRVDNWCMASAALIANFVVFTAHCPAEEERYRSRVGVEEPTRLDWTFAVAQRSVVDPPPEWVQHVYDSAKQTYELYVPARNAGNGTLYPMVLFVSPGVKADGWKHWKQVCRRLGMVFACPHGTAAGSLPSRRIRIALDVLDDVRRRYPIDPDRTSISGFREGGHVACRVAYSLPEYFGGVIPIVLGENPPKELWLRQKTAQRLSIASLNFEVVDSEWVADADVRFKHWGYAGHSHQMPDSATLFQALLWVEQGVAGRRALSASFPSTRIGSAVSRAEHADMELADARRKLQDNATTYDGLLQLEGVCQRWPDVAACKEAKRLLEEYEQRESRPWERQRTADRRKSIEAKISRLEKMAPALKLSDKYKHSRRRADYRHEYAEMKWGASPSPDATNPSISTEYDEATQAVLRRLGSRVCLDRHGRVAMVNLRGTRVTGVQFRHFKEQLQGMPDLRALDLSHTVMPEHVLYQVADLADLQALNLSATSLTTRGMCHLSQLKRLQFLAVPKTSVSSGGFRDLPLREMQVLLAGDTNVTDQLLEQLSEAANLRELSLYSTRITSGGIAELVPLPSLTYLNLGATRIGDAACSSLRQMTTLEELILDNTAIRDEGFAELTALDNLRRLSLQGARVTDAGVKIARDMERLEFLNIKYTGVTERGVDELRSSLSSCEVLWDDEVENRIAAERRLLQQELRSSEE